jgi:hypothetical protein
LTKYSGLVIVLTDVKLKERVRFKTIVQEDTMMKLKDIRKDLSLMNAIDWQMTPEEAVVLYLEWGNNWAHGINLIRSKSDVSHYFVVNNWGKTPIVYLIRRNSEEAVELAEFELPDKLKEVFQKSVAFNKGVYAVEGPVKDWLQKELMH